MSFFGSSSSAKKEEKKTSLLADPDAKNIDTIIDSLMSNAADKDQNVRDTIENSLNEIGFARPVLYLSRGCNYLNNNRKIAVEHRVILLRTLKTVIDRCIDSVNQELASQLVTLAAVEMTADKEIQSDWQNAACILMASLCPRVPNQVAAELLKQCPSGQLPHYFVMKCLADFAHANPIEFVPHLRDVMSRVLPVLAMVKQDNMKWVFAAALGRFSEAVVTHRANTPAGQHMSFSSSMYTAMDILLTQWLQHREQKVRLSTAECIGTICQVLDADQIIGALPRLLPAMIQTLRKEKPADQLPVSQGLSNMLEIGLIHGRAQIEPQMEVLLGTLHTYVCIPPTMSFPLTVKNQNELLRCIEYIARTFTDHTITFLQRSLEAKEPTVRAGSLDIIKHLITRLTGELGSRKDLLISAVKPLVQDQDTKVRKSLCQLIIAMAAQDYLQCAGGHELVQFIVKNSAISEDEISKYNAKFGKEKAPVDAVSPSELRSIADNILNLLTSTLPNTEVVLWPYLFEMVTPFELTDSLGVVCKNLAEIAERKRNLGDPNFYIDFDRSVNVPKPGAILARLFVMLLTPFRRGQVGLNVLSLMKQIGPIMNPAFASLWDDTIPKLTVYLQEKSGDGWNQEKWENLVTRLLSETLDHVREDEWIVQLADASVSFAGTHYNSDPQLKRGALALAGAVIQKVSLKDFVSTALDKLFDATEHGIDEERQGCARAFAHASVTHTDIVLDKWTRVCKGQMSKKSSGGGFFSKEPPKFTFKSTALLSYGFLTMLAPSQLMASRIEVHVINNVLGVLAEGKNPAELRDNALRGIEVMARAMQPKRLDIPNYVLRQRDQVILAVVSQIGNNRDNTKEFCSDKTRLLGVQALTSLSLLEPAISGDVQKKVLECVFGYFERTADVAAKGETPSASSSASSASEDYFQQYFNAIHQLFTAILRMQPTQAMLNTLSTELEKFMLHKDAGVRERSTVAYAHTLKEFAKLSADGGAGALVPLERLGTVAACLVPRSTDSSPAVRQAAVEGLYITLRLGLFLLGLSDGDGMDAAARLGPIRDRVKNSDSKEMFAVAKEISAILANTIPEDQLCIFIETLMKGLTDVETDSANGSCVVFNGILRLRGSTLAPRVSTYICSMIDTMPQLKTRENTLNGLLHCVRALAKHHLLPVMNTLLSFPVPHTVEVAKSLQTMAMDGALSQPMFNHLMDIMNNSQLYDEKPVGGGKTPVGRDGDAKPKPSGSNSSSSPSSKNAALSVILSSTHTPLSATCALGAILELTEVAEVAKTNYHLLLSTILLRVGTANLIAKDAPTKEAVNALNQLLECVDDEDVVEVLKTLSAFDDLNSKQAYPASIEQIVRAIIKKHPELISPMFKFLSPYVSRTYEGQRVAATATIAELLNHVKNDRELVQMMMNGLLGRSGGDEVEPVKLRALKGLANITSQSMDEINRYAPSIIPSLLSCLDDDKDTVILQAMESLAKFFDCAEEFCVSPVLVNVCLRLRPAFENDNDAIRAQAVTLFGLLARFGTGLSAEALRDHLRTNLPSLLLHTNDDSPNVRTACKRTLRALIPLLNCAELTNFFNERQFNPDGRLDYDDFVINFGRIWVRHFPDFINTVLMTLLGFFRSAWNAIRANAALVCGSILCVLTADDQRKVNVDQVCGSIIALLKEPSALVRTKASKALGLLHGL